MGACVLRTAFLAACFGTTIGVARADDGLRIANWNVTNYSGGRVTAFQSAFYDSFEGRSFAPDVVLVEEMLSSGGVTAFLSLLNTASGSPGDWAAAPFINGPDTDNALFYRTSRVDLLNTQVIAVGGGAPNHPRNVTRYDVRPDGYAAETTIIAMYASHMKAGSGSTDQARRLVEAERIRTDAENLNPAWNFLLGGDFNIQSSNQAAYQELTGFQANNAGRFFDPISTPGSWNNNGSFRIVHTQDPSGAGGMDDRHDQILLSGSLVDGLGLDYIGFQGIPYSTVTWNDPNHSYRSWGNDGTSYNVSLTTTGNTMVGPTIATNLKLTASGGGHLPVFLDMKLPAKVTADATIDFGTVNQNDLAEVTLSVANNGDVSLWGAGGIQPLAYTLDPTTGFTVDPGPFVENAGGGSNSHTVGADTSTVGPLSGSISIFSNDPDVAEFVVAITGEVVGGCDADWDGNETLNSGDFLAYLNDYNAVRTGGSFTHGDPDLASPFGTINTSDFLAYLNLYGAGCP